MQIICGMQTPQGKDFLFAIKTTYEDICLNGSQSFARIQLCQFFVFGKMAEDRGRGHHLIIRFISLVKDDTFLRSP